MSETSFPVVEKPLSEDQWKSIALGFGQGVLDQGGWPYLMGTRSNVNNTITINVDQVTGRNEAILSGFVHRIDTPKTLSLPAVTTTTVYEIGLVYDPTKHGIEAGPITLTVWKAPGDVTGGKSRLVIYRVTRSANQLLTDAKVEEWRQRVAPQISVSKPADLPRAENLLVDTVALVRNTNEWYRLDRPGTGTQKWIKVSDTSGVDAVTAELNKATAEATPHTLVRRSSGGTFHANVGTNPSDVINRGYLDEALGGGPWKPATPLHRGDAIMRRWSNGNAYVSSDVDSAFSIINREVGDSRYLRAGASIDGERLNKNGNPVWWELITGSKSAYREVSGGSTWATVAVSSAGKFFRYPSALKYKKNIRPWDVSPAAAVSVTPIKYEDKESGDTRVGIPADSYVDTIPELVVRDPETGEVEGWQYMLMPVLQQVVIRDHDARLQAVESENAKLRATVAELVDRVTALESKEN